ncbi:MAG: DUF192 domain-containing protein [Pseudomonadota bacterium]|nr:DUF192 domain-containing protein [Pseudomonadota bacterium]
MVDVRVQNATRGTVLAERAGLAIGFWDRLRGLLGRTSLLEGTGLWLQPCNSVHMWFMRFPIDVVFATREGRVVAVVPTLRPWAMTRPYFGAAVALELPVGMIARTGTALGDQLIQEPACV